MTEQSRALFLKFLSKFTFDVMPAALASIVGGFLFTQYNAAPPPPKPAVAELSRHEMERTMQMVREEHELMVDYIKAQQAAAERAKDDLARSHEEAKADAVRREVEAKLAAARVAETKRRLAEQQAAQAARQQAALMPRKPPEPGRFAVDEPLNITPTLTPPPAPRGPVASVIATARDLKDKVVATTDEIKGWLESTTDRLLGRASSSASPPARLISASW